MPTKRILALLAALTFGSMFAAYTAHGQLDPNALKKKGAQLAGKAKKVVKKGLAELMREGRKGPTKARLAKARRSAAKLFAPKGEGVAFRISDADLAALRTRYEALEKAAPAELLATLSTLAADVKKKKWSFEVGVTSASMHPPHLMPRIGTRKKRPASLGTGHPEASVNSYERFALARALPPADLQEHDEDDGELSSFEGSVQLDKVQGTKGVTFPSLAFPKVDVKVFLWRITLG